MRPMIILFVFIYYKSLDFKVKCYLDMFYEYIYLKVTVNYLFPK